jgi:hypothetical protein
MPITDNDLLQVVETHRNGSTNIGLTVKWTDGFTGEDRGSFTVDWPDVEFVKTFLADQNFNDVLRYLLLQCLNRTTGALRASVFDAMPGKSFRVLAKVQEV